MPLWGSRWADCCVAQYTTPASETIDTAAPIHDAREPRRRRASAAAGGSGAGGAGRSDAGAGVSMWEMMADGPSGTLIFLPVAREIALPGERDAWTRLGFTPGAPVGALRARPGAAHLEVGVEGLAAERPRGLALVSAAGPEAHPAEHRNGAT